MRVDFLYIILMIAFLIYVFALLIIAVKTNKPFSTMAGGAATGIAALAVVDLTSTFTGVFIPLNVWTVSSSAAFGIPGVISLLIVNKIMI